MTLWDCTLYTTNQLQGSNNPNLNTMVLDDLGDATNVVKFCTRMQMALNLMVQRDALGGVAYFNSTARQFGTDFQQAAPLSSVQWALDYANIAAAYRGPALPATVPAQGVTYGNGVFAGLGDAIYVKKGLVVVNPQGPRRGGMYLSVPASNYTNPSTGLVKSTVQSDVSQILSALFLGANNPVVTAPLPKVGDAAVYRQATGIINYINQFTVGNVPSRLRSRTR